jgi:hypothetical protein
LLHTIYVFIHPGPGWLNELGSWITKRLIQAYHQYGVGSCPALLITKKGAFDSQPQVIKFTSCLPMVSGSLRVLRLHPPLKTGCHDIAEILLKVVLNTKNQIIHQSIIWFLLDDLISTETMISNLYTRPLTIKDNINSNLNLTTFSVLYLCSYLLHLESDMDMYFHIYFIENILTISLMHNVWGPSWP